MSGMSIQYGLAGLVAFGCLALSAACGSSSPDGSGIGGSSSGSGGVTASASGSGAGGASTGSGGGGSGTGGSGSGGGAAGGGGMDVRPEKPADLISYVTGSDADADVAPTGPGVILMGGGTDVDAAFEWWKPYISGGDVVVLRASGADGYNDYLYKDIGGCDSVETLLVTSEALAKDPYVAWTVAHAEGIFMAGGDQANYLTYWKDTPLEDAIMAAYKRGAVVGGTSAGCAVLGEFMFAAYNDTVYSEEALGDPYTMYMTMERDFLAIPLLASVITDTHFAERDRMGRLVGFLARIVADGWAASAIGIGVDEKTAIVAGPDGKGSVLGSGSAYVLRSNGPPATCAPGMQLEYGGLLLTKLSPGDAVDLPSGATQDPGSPLSASGGALMPAKPY